MASANQTPCFLISSHCWTIMRRCRHNQEDWSSPAIIQSRLGLVTPGFNLQWSVLSAQTKKNAIGYCQFPSATIGWRSWPVGSSRLASAPIGSQWFPIDHCRLLSVRSKGKTMQSLLIGYFLSVGLQGRWNVKTDCHKYINKWKKCLIYRASKTQYILSPYKQWTSGYTYSNTIIIVYVPENQDRK